MKTSDTINTILSQSFCSAFKYARYENNKLELSDKMEMPNGSVNCCILQDGQYVIKDNILYLRAKEIFFINLDNYLESVNIWDSPKVFLYDKDTVDKLNLAEDLEVKTITKTTIFGRHYSYDVVDCSKTSSLFPTLFRLKETEPFYLITNNFEIFDYEV